MRCRTYLKTSDTISNKLEQENIELEGRITEHENKPRAKENPPSRRHSLQRFKGNSCANTNLPGKLGTPVGHRNVMHAVPEPEEI